MAAVVLIEHKVADRDGIVGVDRQLRYPRGRCEGHVEDYNDVMSSRVQIGSRRAYLLDGGGRCSVS